MLRKYFTYMVALVALPVSQTWAKEPDLPTGRSERPKSTANFQCSSPSSRAELDINNVRALIHNAGDMWWDLIGSARYEVPKTTDPAQTRLNAMFAGGVWVGGQDPTNNEPLLMAQTYRSGIFAYWPGPVDTITASTSKARCQEWDQHFRCDKRTILQYDFDISSGALQVPVQTSSIPEQIRYWPGRNNRFLRQRPGRAISDLDFSLAPFIDKNGNGNYEPDLGEYPQLPGDDGVDANSVVSAADQTYWFIMNDVGNTKNFSSGNPSPNNPIGMEVHVEAFAYATSDPRNDMTFYRNKLINKGQRTLSNTFFGQFADPDLGNYSDDYVGFDVARGLGYCYNGDDNDEGPLGYGLNPPTVGIDYFIGPQADPNDGIDNDKDCTIDEPEEKIIASDFLYYNNQGGTTTDGVSIKNGNPGTAQEYYNYLQNIWRNNDPVSYDGQLGTTRVGQVNANRPELGPVARSRYIFPGSSDQSICWGYEGTCANPCPNGRLTPWDERSAGNPPGDRRFLISAGPFTLVPGASNQLTISVIWARASSGGATGSFGKLLVADDLSQALFDRNFKILLGPNEPKVDITEYDGELLMTITPDVFRGQSTEQYVTVDPSLNPLFGDNAYRFEGYIVYQLRDATVGTADLTDPNRAQIIAQFDIQNNIGTITNREFDPVLNERVPVIKVNGANKGISNSIRITRDAFNTERERLVNFKKYYYRVIAYAYNSNTQNNEPFLLGFPRQDPATGQIIDRIEAIPHKVDPERGGTVVSSTFNQGLDVTRVSGFGNGGNTLNSINENDLRTIIETGGKSEVTYLAGNTPVNVRVYNPKAVKSGNFTMQIFSRMVYNPAASTYTFKTGDTLISLYNPGSLPTGGGTIQRLVSDTSGRTRGIAVVRQVINYTADSADLVVQVLNEGNRGTFVATQEIRNCTGTGGSCSDTRFSRYDTYQFDFVRYSPATGTEFSGERGRVRTFLRNDFWTLSESSTNATFASRRSVRAATEQLIPEFGISVAVPVTEEPGYRPAVNRTLGLQTSSIVNDLRQPWYVGIPNRLYGAHNVRNSQSWLLDDRTTGSTDDYTYPDFLASDPALFTNKILPLSYLDDEGTTQQGGRVAPYFSTALGGNSGPGARRPVNLARTASNDFRNLRSVDIVFTPDRSLWTEVIVFQHDSLGSAIVTNQFQKSRVPSIDINGQTVNEASPFTGTRIAAGQNLAGASRGRAWFPGYAIDLDRGIRLNMAFSESYLVYGNQIHGNKGNDLKFNFPVVNNNGIPLGDTSLNKHFAYVLTSQYVPGVSARNLEREVDSILFASTISLAQRTRVYDQFFQREMMWVAYPAIRQGAGFNNEARIRMRVNRPYTATAAAKLFEAKPVTFSFNTNGIEARRFVAERGNKALDLIRVVPNPYYAYNEDANSQIDARVKIVNIPTTAKISIFSLSGILVRQFNVDFPNTGSLNQTTYVEWDLKNQVGIPVASGTYIIHVDGGPLGEKVVKFFGVMRPIDLDGIRLN